MSMSNNRNMKKEDKYGEIPENSCLCNKCGYYWTARKKNPRCCPFCHSYKWSDGELQPFPPGVTREDYINSGMAEFDCNLAEEGMDDYAEMLRREDKAPEQLKPMFKEGTPRDKKIAGLRELLPADTHEEAWVFTKDAPQYGEDVNVYRRQALGKRTRSVQVDQENFDIVVRIMK